MIALGSEREKGNRYSVSEIDIAEVQDWAREAGALAKSYFNRVERSRKADRSYVTRADTEIEEMLRTHIAAQYPQHGIMGEEQGIGAIDREFVWSLDPLDGTDAYTSGLAVWGVSIGVLRAGKPYLGVIYLPLLDDCYWADAEGAAFRNDERLAVNPTTTIDSNDWLAIGSYTHRRFMVDFPGKTRSLSCVAADFCYVARGSALGALIPRASLWDIAAGLRILEAAGGVAYGLSGQTLNIGELLDGHKLPEAVIISSPQLNEKIRGCVRVRP
ncbi:inositol monophosphatase [Candidatus Gracilibacteria bacterium]|nr:inositol monophosphatase [Candidatus Gracilibacteria bacterium]